MFKRKKNEMITCGIIGLGRFGSSLALALAQSGTEIVAIDRDEEKVREIREYTENAFVVHNLDKKTLADTGIQNCDVAVVCMAEHMEVSILTTLNIVSMGVAKVIAKANSPEHGEVLEKLGAEVVYPEKDMAIRLANRLETSQVLDIIQLSEKINISKIKAPDHMVGKTVVEAKLRERFGLNIIAIENNGNVMEIIKPDYVFAEKDVLFITGSRDGLIRLAEWIEKN